MPDLIDLIRELETAVRNATAAASLAYDSGQNLCFASKDRRQAETHDYALDQAEILTRRALDLVSALVSHPAKAPKLLPVRKRRVTPSVTPKKPQTAGCLLNP